MFGIMYNYKRAYISASLLTVGFIFHYVPMFIVGIQGMPRRYYDYLPQFETGNFLAGFGGIMMVAAMALMFFNLVISFKEKKIAQADPWGGTTLEWSVPSPPPLHNFVEEPQVKPYPYDFSDVIARAKKAEK